MAELCCPIEMEPRTLNGGQLNHAREAAVDIAQKMESVETSYAFTEGLKPVVPIKEMEEMVERRHQLHVLVAEVNDRTYECACSTNNVDETPDISKIREPLSAPF